MFLYASSKLNNWSTSFLILTYQFDLFSFQKESYQQTITSLEEKQEALSKSLSELDALNSKWSQKNSELSDRLKEQQVKYVI